MHFKVGGIWEGRRDDNFDLVRYKRTKIKDRQQEPENATQQHARPLPHTTSSAFGFNNISSKTRYSSLKAATSCLNALWSSDKHFISSATDFASLLTLAKPVSSDFFTDGLLTACERSRNIPGGAGEYKVLGEVLDSGVSKAWILS